MKIEAIFGGVLALVVLSVAVYALATTKLGHPGGDLAGSGSSKSSIVLSSKVAASGRDEVCSCFNDAFKLAGSKVGVMSAQYRTGFEQCRATLGVDGGNAWTAGWNARVSAKPYEASCRAYRKRAA